MCARVRVRVRARACVQVHAHAHVCGSGGGAQAHGTRLCFSEQTPPFPCARDRAASLLLATPSASRGLDLPAVSHVYSLGLPSDAKEYLHRAGRAGRIGSTTGGLVTTIVTPEELQRLRLVADELGITLAVEAEAEQGMGLLPPQAAEGSEGAASASGMDAVKLGLEDIFNLM